MSLDIHILDARDRQERSFVGDGESERARPGQDVRT